MVFELRQILIAANRRAEIGMVGADDAFDGMETILEPPSRIVKFVEQLLILSGQCLGLLPLGDVVEDQPGQTRSEEHTSELQSLMRISYAVFCLKKKK